MLSTAKEQESSSKKQSSSINTKNKLSSEEDKHKIKIALILSISSIGLGMSSIWAINYWKKNMTHEYLETKDFIIKNQKKINNAIKEDVIFHSYRLVPGYSEKYVKVLENLKQKYSNDEDVKNLFSKGDKMIEAEKVGEYINNKIRAHETNLLANEGYKKKFLDHLSTNMKKFYTDDEFTIFKEQMLNLKENNVSDKPKKLEDQILTRHSNKMAISSEYEKKFLKCFDGLPYKYSVDELAHLKLGQKIFALQYASVFDTKILKAHLNSVQKLKSYQYNKVRRASSFRGGFGVVATAVAAVSTVFLALNSSFFAHIENLYDELMEILSEKKLKQEEIDVYIKNLQKKM